MAFPVPGSGSIPEAQDVPGRLCQFVAPGAPHRDGRPNVPDGRSAEQVFELPLYRGIAGGSEYAMGLSETWSFGSVHRRGGTRVTGKDLALVKDPGPQARRREPDEGADPSPSRRRNGNA